MNNNRHRSLERALDILELLASNREGLTLSNISSELDIPKSSALSLLSTLVHRKYAIYDKDSGKYRMGIKMFEVGSGYFRESDYMNDIMAAVTKLSKESDETIHLGVLDGRDVIYIFKTESSQPIRMVSSIGKRIPAHATAIGKALLSGLSDEQLIELYENEQLEKLTNNTICNFDVLLDEIHAVRDRGYAMECEESSEGVECFAAPIVNGLDQVIAAVSIAVPIMRVNVENSSIFIKLIIDGAKEISDIIKKYFRQSIV
jgi:DNA-binding IclR family transcriptional regulator